MLEHYHAFGPNFVGGDGSGEEAGDQGDMGGETGDEQSANQDEGIL